MAHPLYSHCRQFLNQPVTVYLHTGQLHYGVLHDVTTEGVLLMPLSAQQTNGLYANQVTNAENYSSVDVQAQRIFAAPLFLPFAALAGLTLGYVAGSSIPRPYPYGYGGGYGYGPGYGGGGYGYGPGYGGGYGW